MHANMFCFFRRRKKREEIPGFIFTWLLFPIISHILILDWTNGNPEAQSTHYGQTRQISTKRA